VVVSGRRSDQTSSWRQSTCRLHFAFWPEDPSRRAI